MVPHTSDPRQGDNDRIELETAGFEDLSTKSLSRATLIVEPRRYGPDKLILELESPDGYQYRFQKFETGENERFRYMNRENPDGDVSTNPGNLPKVTDAYLANIAGNDPRGLAVEEPEDATTETTAAERARADGGRPPWTAGERAAERAAVTMTMTPAERANRASIDPADDDLRADGGHAEVVLDMSTTPPRQHDPEQLPEDATDAGHVEEVSVATAEAEDARMCGRCYAATDGGVVAVNRGPTPAEFRAYAAEDGLHGHCVKCGTRTNETNDDGQAMCTPCQRAESGAESDARTDGGRHAGRGQETLGDAYQRSRAGVSGDPVPDAEYADEPPEHDPADDGAHDHDPEPETCDECGETDEFHLLRHCPRIENPRRPLPPLLSDDDLADTCDGCAADRWLCRDCHPAWGEHSEHDDGPTGETFRPGEGFPGSQSGHQRNGKCPECGAVKTTGYGNNGRSARCQTCGEAFL